MSPLPADAYPSWRSEGPTGAIDADAYAQFLVAHASQVLYQGQRALATGAGPAINTTELPLHEWLAMTGAIVDQQFTSPSAGGLGWVRLPVTHRALGTGPQVTQTGSVVNGSNVLTLVDGTEVQQFAPVFGPGIPLGTTIAAVLSPTTFQMSANANATVGGTYSFAPAMGTAFLNPADLTLSVYTDAAGVPGTLVAQVTVPKELLTAAASSSWPESNELLTGPWTADPQAQFPPFPGAFGNCYLNQCLTAGSVACLIATPFSGTSFIYTATYLDGELGPWRAGPATPTNCVGGEGALAYAPTSQVVVLVGGFSSGSATSDVWTATIDQQGNMGAWQQQSEVGSPTAPFNTAGPQITVATVDGQDYLYLIPAGTNQVWYAPIGPSGQITQWAQGPNMASAFNTSFGGAAGLVAIGNTLYLACPDAPLTLECCSIFATELGASGVPGTWTRASNATMLISPADFYASMQVLGDTLQVCLQTDGPELTIAGSLEQYRYTLEPTGSAVLGRLNASSSGPTGSAPFAYFSNPDGSWTTFWAVPSLPRVGDKVSYLPSSWVNVPIGAVLTPSTTYHLTIGVAGGSAPTKGVNLALGQVGATGVTPAKISTNGGATWSTLTGMAAVVFGWIIDSTGPVIGFVDDSGARVSSWWYDPLTYKLQDCAEWAGSSRSVAVIEYNDDGTFAGLEEVA